jgi:hypothetical protein
MNGDFIGAKPLGLIGRPRWCGGLRATSDTNSSVSQQD